MEVRPARTAADYAEVECLIRAYLDELPFEIDFQDLDRELASLASEYGPPSGAGFLAHGDGSPVGFVGIRRFDGADAELKRMYVAPAARGGGVGRLLAEEAVSAARSLGYERLLLDTVATMTGAIAIYTALGFRPTGPYRHNPLPDARFFVLDLR